MGRWAKRRRRRRAKRRRKRVISRKEYNMRRKQNEEGYVLVTITVLIVVFLGFTALSVDTGMLYSARTSAQKAADAAALAGAFTFVADTNSTQPDTAKAHAVAVAGTNNVFGQTVTIST